MRKENKTEDRERRETKAKQTGKNRDAREQQTRADNEDWRNRVRQQTR
jgi:hypothetical protein